MHLYRHAEPNFTFETMLWGPLVPRAFLNATPESLYGYHSSPERCRAPGWDLEDQANLT